MIHSYDVQSKVTHIKVEGLGTLCGIVDGYVRPNQEPAKEKFGSTCEGCQEQVRDIKQLKVNDKYYV